MEKETLKPDVVETNDTPPENSKTTVPATDSVVAPAKKASPWVKTVVAGVLCLGIFGGLAGWLLGREKPVELPPTLLSHADKTLEFDDQAKEVDLLRTIEREEHFYKIHPTNFFLKPKNGIRYARILFYLQAKKYKDLDLIERNEPVILETLNRTLLNSTVEEFEGPQGKEQMRAKLVEALNRQLPFSLQTVRYGSLTFH